MVLLTDIGLSECLAAAPSVPHMLAGVTQYVALVNH